MTTWDEIRDEIAGMLADGESLENIIGKLEEMKNEMQKPITNEEWFNGLPTTEKSEFMAKMVTDAIKEHNEHGATRCESVIWWDEWLKEKHDAK